jgi:hypothetical protein
MSPSEFNRLWQRCLFLPAMGAGAERPSGNCDAGNVAHGHRCDQTETSALLPLRAPRESILAPRREREKPNAGRSGYFRRSDAPVANGPPAAVSHSAAARWRGGTKRTCEWRTALLVVLAAPVGRRPSSPPPFAVPGSKRVARFSFAATPARGTPARRPPPEFPLRFRESSRATNGIVQGPFRQASNRSGFHHCLRSVSATIRNRRVRTRMYGSVAGAGG